MKNIKNSNTCIDVSTEQNDVREVVYLCICPDDNKYRKKENLIFRTKDLLNILYSNSSYFYFHYSLLFFFIELRTVNNGLNEKKKK